MNLDEALRDAAEPVSARVAQPHAQALLDRVVHSPVTRATARTRTRRLRLVTVGALAVVSTLAALALPKLGSSPAYASWSPTAEPIPAADQADLTDRCGAAVRAEYQTQSAPRLILGERRGEYAAVSVGAGDWSATCFRDRDGSVLYSSFLNQPVSTPTLGRNGVELQGWPEVRTAEGYCRLMAGHVGSDVVAVDIIVNRSDVQSVVRATVGQGYFLAWYPAKTGGENTMTTLTLRLADGGTVDDVSARALMERPMQD